MNRICFLVVLLLFHFSLNAQVALQWQNTIGGNAFDGLEVITQTMDGGFICGGVSNSTISGDKIEDNQGSYDFWIIKLDSLGNIQWQNTIGGSDSDVLYSISPTADGGYICGGYSSSGISGDKTENSMGFRDYWVVKLDQVGNIEWQNTIGGNGYDYLYSISQTLDGGYICGGISSSNISGDKTENCLGLYDFWVVKLDDLGNIQWQNTIQGDYEEHLNKISQTVDGGYIIGGDSNSGISADKSENCQGGYDYWLVKLDQTGNVQWQNTIGGSNMDQLFAISQTYDGGFICGGYSFSDISGDKTENSHGDCDYWILKLDASGNIQWQNTIGGNSFDYFKSIFQSMDGGYVCGGHTRSNISGDKTENSFGGNDFWILKLDASGNIQWQNSIGGNDDDTFGSIIQTTDGDYICGGTSNSNISGDKIENSLGGVDYWVAKLTSNFNSIMGKNFLDLNSNNIFDFGESLLGAILMIETNTGSIGISGNNGIYNVAVFDTGNFNVIPNFTLTNYTAIPVSHTAYFSSMLQTDSLNDFAFQPNGLINDLQISITPTTPFRPGFNAMYNLHYKNIGTTSLAGTVIFYPDSGITFVSSSVTPSLVTADSVLWQTGNLNPFDEASILVTVNVNTTIQIGSTINSCAKIEPVAGDAIPSDNFACREIVVTGSSDPNDILVDRATITTTELMSPPYLDYIIRFQNTGTDTAFNVKVLNPIDTTMLQLQTFELVTTSHPANVTWKAWERNMEFQFDNILLPDSNVNEPMSHGFIRYRIKPKSTLIVGDSVKNSAYIYFDFNNPVATNTAITEIILPTSVSFIDDVVDFTIFPNPTKNNVTVSIMLQKDAKVEINVFNALGQLQSTESGDFSSGKNEFNIETNNFPKGIYYVKVDVDGRVAVKKLVKI